jgi:predicted GH43/DUF377 family glycosyl hydrolase
LLLTPSISFAQSASNESSQVFQWKRNARNPVIPAFTDTWMETQAANPDLLLMGDTYYLYYSGQQQGHNRIGVATIPRNQFDGFTWKFSLRPLINVGAAGSPDEMHCLDPATVLVKSRVFLYYTGVDSLGHQTICLTISSDGTRFTKYEKNPVLTGCDPEVVYSKNTFYLFFRRSMPGKEGFEIHYATSPDGFHFTEPTTDPVLSVGSKGSWDSFSLQTPRIFSEGNLFYMVYCGSDRYKEYPWNAGLATSRDLIHWEKYTGNPIFTRGMTGTWDEGAIWHTMVEKINGHYYMWYEGTGGGTTRTKPFESYLLAEKLQIGLANLDAPYFYVRPGKKK